MTTSQLLILCVFLTLWFTICAYVIVVKSPGKSQDSLVGRTLVLNTKPPGELTVRGTVHSADSEQISLRDVVFISGDGKGTPAGGYITVPRDNVSTIQEMPA